MGYKDGKCARCNKKVGMLEFWKDTGLCTTCACKQDPYHSTDRIVVKPPPDPLERLRRRAKSKVSAAIRDGVLTRPTQHMCYLCKKPAARWFHHAGFDKVNHLNVKPVCLRCLDRARRERTWEPSEDLKMKQGMLFD